MAAPAAPQGPVVRAAGGVVVRAGAGGGPQFALVHRPKHGDWSLPKGKLDPGETSEQAARREVAEETGLACELGEELAPARYRLEDGREKVVRFWLMRPVSDAGFTPGEEVDALRWADAREALALLEYEHDRALVRAVEGDSAAPASDKRPAG